MDELVAALSRETSAVEALLFRLLEAQALLRSRQVRFFGWAASDIERAAAAVQEADVERRSILSGFVQGAAPGPTLEELAVRQREPFTSLLEEHRAALQHVTREVAAAVDALDDLANAGLAQLDGSVMPPATLIAEAPRPMDDLDQEIAAAGYQAVLAATGGLSLDGLEAFLAERASH